MAQRGMGMETGMEMEMWRETVMEMDMAMVVVMEMVEIGMN